MADTNTAPLTDEERAELEALRAEQARAEAAARTAAPPAGTPAPAAPAQPAKPKKQPAPKPSSKDEPEAAGQDEKTFGVRMVTSDTVDKDGIPTMPVAQKVLIAIAVVGVAAFFALYVI